MCKYNGTTVHNQKIKLYIAWLVVARATAAAAAVMFDFAYKKWPRFENINPISTLFDFYYYYYYLVKLDLLLKRDVLCPLNCLLCNLFYLFAIDRYNVCFMVRLYQLNNWCESPFEIHLIYDFGKPKIHYKTLCLIFPNYSTI